MELTTEQIMLRLGQKDLEIYGLQMQVQRLQALLAEKQEADASKQEGC